MSEKGFEYRHAAAYQPSVDFDYTAKNQRGKSGQGKQKPYVKRNVLASSHAVSRALRFWTKRANRVVVTTQLLRGQFAHSWN